MNEKKVKKIIIKRASILFGIIFVGGALIAAILYLNNSAEEENKKLKSAISSIKSDLSSFQGQMGKFKESLEIWDSLPESKKATEGARITEAKDLISSLEEKYELIDLNVISSKPSLSVESASKENDEKKIDIYESKINLKFSSLTDEIALKFIDDLYKNFPGFVQISNFEMKKNGDLTDDQLKLISLGQSPKLVNVSIAFTWKELKDFEKEEIEEPNDNENSEGEQG